MRVTCRKSGINWTVPQFSCSAGDKQEHPVFKLSQTQLFVQIKEFVRGNLKEEEIVLLYLALADSTNKIEWRSPFKLTESAPAIMSQKLTDLAGTVSRINEIRHPHFQVPVYVCSPHAGQNTIKGFSNCLDSWNEAIAEFAASSVAAAKASNILRMEEGIERLLRISKQKPVVFAKAIANWAVIAGEFPDGDTIVGGELMPLADYWRSIIIRCVLQEGLHTIPESDIAELVEHCEDMIPHGSIHAAALMEALRNGCRQKMEFLGRPALAGTKLFAMIPQTAADRQAVEKEMAVMKAMAASAPLTLPEREQYATVFLYQQAMARWRMAQRLKEAEAKAAAEAESKAAGNAEDVL